LGLESPSQETTMRVAPWPGSHQAPSGAAWSFRSRDLTGAAARPVASLAALVVAVGHSLGSTLRKVFPVDLHQMPNVATSHDIMETHLM
jgi:hypothetical protein